MAPLTMMLALAACLVGVAQAAAVKSKLPITHPNHPDRPKPIQPAEDCDVKRLPCVPVYTEEGARRLAELGIMEQVAIQPTFPEEMLRAQSAPPSAKRKTPCRRKGGCRRKYKSQRAAPHHGTPHRRLP
ncbi:hypothetical protein R5R35_004301 [Gryllus longicercus]|uniref:Uncharacterized protein n=1 Tax=Gryllus longicercus TaxID=2509291 RepID=A0AAN9VSE3_9ORTH